MKKWNPKVRWYDWLAALVAAEFLFRNVMVMLYAPNIWIQILAGVSVYFVYELWVSTYCKFRLVKEFRRYYNDK